MGWMLVVVGLLCMLGEGRKQSGPDRSDARAVELQRMERELEDLEEASLQRWTAAVAEAQRAGSDAMAERTNAARVRTLHKASDFLREQRRVIAYLWSELEATQRAEKEAKEAEALLRKTAHTVDVVKAGADRAAVEYDSFNDQAVQQVGTAVEDLLSHMAPLQRAAAQWQADARANATHLAKLLQSHTSRVASEVDRSRARARSLQRIAAAAGRLLTSLQSGPADSTTLLRTLVQQSKGSTPDPWPRQARQDLSELEAWDPDFAAAVAALRAADTGFRQRHALWSAAHADAQAGWNGTDFSWVSTGERWPSDPAWDVDSINSASVRMLLRSVRSVLGMHAADRFHAALTRRQDTQAEEQREKGTKEKTEGEGEGVPREGPWVAVEAQAKRLRAAREVLEAELWRRSRRSPPEAWWQAGAALGGKGEEEEEGEEGALPGSPNVPVPPFASSTAAQGTPEGVQSETLGKVAAAVLQRMPNSGLPPGKQGELELATLAERGTGTLWSEADALEQEAERVRGEEADCRANPEQYRPGCGPRLAWEHQRLSEEASHRRVVALAAWSAWTHVREEAHSANEACRRGSKNATQPCSDAAVAARGLVVRSAARALESGHASQDGWAERVELRCLWAHRNETIAPLLSLSVERAPADADETEAGKGAREAVGPRLRRLWEVCEKLDEPPLTDAPGSGVFRDCLCGEAETVRRWWKKVWDEYAEER